MKGDEGLIATLKPAMPGLTERKDLPKYKCFNRYPHLRPEFVSAFLTNWSSKIPHLALVGLPCPSAALKKPISS